MQRGGGSGDWLPESFPLQPLSFSPLWLPAWGLGLPAIKPGSACHTAAVPLIVSFLFHHSVLRPLAPGPAPRASS